MQIPIKAQIAFLDLQIQASEEEYRSYALSPVQNLRAVHRLHVGLVFAMDAQGNVILRFKKEECPRLKVPYELLTYDPGKAGKSATWHCSLYEFRKQFVDGNTEAEPIYFWDKEDPVYSYVGCMGVDTQTAGRITLALQNGIHPPVLLTELPPPLEYFLNLQTFIQNSPDNPILNISVDKDLTTWNPALLSHDMRKADIIAETLAKQGCAIVQGPPGTGKTHLVSEIVLKYAAAGKNVVVTALANKALIELARNKSLEGLLEAGRVRKTRLTANEAVSAKGLQDAGDLNCPKGHLLLATYFKLSDVLAETANLADKEPYDLLVIEEASQAFLATIAGFSKLAKHILIVGDPAQLPPIVKEQDTVLRIHPALMSFAQGLETVAANTDQPAFMLQDTYRLSPAAARLTGVFYNDKLRSQQPPATLSVNQPVIQSYFSTSGGTTLLYTPSRADADANATDLILELVSALLQDDRQRAVAVLTPQRQTVRTLQSRLRSWTEKSPHLTIETVDRIQGLTVDYCIYFLPVGSGTFALEPKRFNVATSRARKGTLIIVNELFARFSSTSSAVKKYLEACEVVHSEKTGCAKSNVE